MSVEKNKNEKILKKLVDRLWFIGFSV